MEKTKVNKWVSGTRCCETEPVIKIRPVCRILTATNLQQIILEFAIQLKVSLIYVDILLEGLIGP